MALIDDVKTICDRLSPLGWREMLLNATSGALDIKQSTSRKLHAELTKSLDLIDRTTPGLTDFSLFGEKAITTGLPAESLLYHALASPGVANGVSGFPSLNEIETIENYVFGANPLTLRAIRSKAGMSETEELSVVLFSYEYRPAKDTCTRRHADMVFSRTGVSRVGTRSARYNARDRGFHSDVDDDPFAFRVCPARFAAFLAVKRKGADVDVMNKEEQDSSRDFWVPIHKLFNGKDCISGLDLRLIYKTFHYNDKIRRTRAITLGLQNVPTSTPFQFTEGIAGLPEDSSFPPGLVMPMPHSRLVEEARVDGELLTFRVPPARRGFAALEPGASRGTDGSEIRPAPAYVHARSEVIDGTVVDLNNDSTRPDVNATVSAGDYEALHYIDFTGDGWIEVDIPALGEVPDIAPISLPAYSLVAAPDMFQSVGQREVFESVPETLLGAVPRPLSAIRLPPNLQIPGNRFNASEETISAIISLFGSQSASEGMIPISVEARRYSCLPDDCAGIFAPGWDVSTDEQISGNSRVQHLAAYGLGSPFPEDAKLCAALASFWPAVAPDASRTMSPHSGNGGLRATIYPLTDEEIGQIGGLPWDGVIGPHVHTLDAVDFLDCESFMHVDYVRNALDGRFTPRLTNHVSSDEYRNRMLAIGIVYRILGGDKNKRFVVSFRKVNLGDPELQRAQLDSSTVLSGDTYRVDIIFGGSSTERAHPTDFRRRLLPIVDRQFFLSNPQTGIALRRKSAQTVWSRVP